MKEPDVLKEINQLFGQTDEPQRGDSLSESIRKMEAMINKREKK